jgi:hypothetical protein
MNTKVAPSKVTKSKVAQRETYSHTSRFFENSFNTLSKIVNVLWIVIVFLAGLIFIRAIWGVDDPQYFALNPKGQIAKLEVLEKPPTSPKFVQGFIYDALMQGFTPVAAKDQETFLKNVAYYYVDTGFEQYKQLSAPFISKKQGGAVVSLVFDSPFKLDTEKSQVYDGVQVWVYKITIRHLIQQNGALQEVVRTYSVAAKQVPFDRRPLGIAIYSIKVES